MKSFKERIGDLYERVKREPRRRLVALMLVLGAGLYLISFLLMPNEEPVALDPSEPVLTRQDDLEQRLTETLRLVKGVGKVQVLLTLERQGSTVYQVDERYSASDTSESEQKDTVVVSGEGLVQTVYAPEYRGAVVVCQGADRASVVQAVKEAVGSLTGLKHDEITVIKMKD